MNPTGLARKLPVIPLLAVLAVGARQGWILFHSHKTTEMPMQSSNEKPPQKSVSAQEIAKARSEIRLLTLNAQSTANRQRRQFSDRPVSFPSFEDVVRLHVRVGALSAPLAEDILAENSRRDASIRIRVRYIYQSRNGSPFAVLTNDEIDRTVSKADNPAGMTLCALGLSDQGFEMRTTGYTAERDDRHLTVRATPAENDNEGAGKREL